MSIGFYAVGAVIFAVYMYFTIWNIIYSSKKQTEDNYSNYTSNVDSVDMDGMGNFSRFPKTEITPKKRRLTKSQKKMKS